MRLMKIENFLNTFTEETDLTSGGSLFQSQGAEDAKELRLAEV